MHAWRIYRLPGSRTIWHIDSGCGTAVVNVTGFKCFVNSEAVDVPNSQKQPRAWIQVNADGVELHVINGIANFSHSSDPVRQTCLVQETIKELRDDPIFKCNPLPKTDGE